MTLQEIHLQISQHYQRMNSGLVMSVEPGELDLVINRVIEQMILSAASNLDKFTPANSQRATTLQAISPLVKTVSYPKTAITLGSRYTKTVSTIQAPADFYHFIDSGTTVYCNGGQRVLQSKFINNPVNYLSSHFTLLSGNDLPAFLENNILYFVTAGRFIIDSIDLNYIKQPVKVQLGTIENGFITIEPEIEQSFHEMLIINSVNLVNSSIYETTNSDARSNRA